MIIRPRGVGGEMLLKDGILFVIVCLSVLSVPCCSAVLHRDNRPPGHSHNVCICSPTSGGGHWAVSGTPKNVARRDNQVNSCDKIRGRSLSGA
jgi:hypothetical protein